MPVGSSELPSGTVTFLSQRRRRPLARLRDRYAEVLGEHHRVLRAAFDAHGGRDVGTQGDGFFVAFARAADAIAAAASLQRSLAAREWPEGVDVRVPLAAVQRPEDVPAGILKTLAVVVLSGESAEEPPSAS